MIQLTRLRHGEQFFLNPDLFERVDTHVDTVVRLTDGTEYVVCERGEEIVRKIAEFRARIIAIAGVLHAQYQGDHVVVTDPDRVPDEPNGDTPAPQHSTTPHALDRARSPEESA